MTFKPSNVVIENTYNFHVLNQKNYFIIYFVWLFYVIDHWETYFFYKIYKIPYALKAKRVKVNLILL